jgi:endosialidase-like protein
MRIIRIACVVGGFLSLALSISAQTSSRTFAPAQVPPLLQFSNVATDEDGNSLSGVISIRFSLYNAQQGGEPLWTETQSNIQLDPTGHYSAQLGITKPAGVPTALFTTGEVRWLGVKIGEQAEQPRVLLVSVPYALKAGDAATIGGLPPSAFVLAAAPSLAPNSEAAVAPSSSPDAVPSAGTTTGSGTTDFVPLWTGSTSLGNSALFQTGASPTAKIGINTTTPASALDVIGGGTIRGTLSLPASATATATQGANSQALNLAASAFNSTSSTALNQTFQWQAEPANNDTNAPSGTLNLLFGEGTSKPTETGLSIASNGRITFASGQTFPTVTGNEIVTGNISSDGSVNAATEFDLNGRRIDTGSVSKQNAFVGFAGGDPTLGTDNTAIGFGAFALNSTGSSNTAIGAGALPHGFMGNNNTAVGENSGTLANGSPLLTGNFNTALGGGAAWGTGTLSNATAVGANAEVDESNALVLGSIKGVNQATASTHVGIGTTAPRSVLEVAFPAASALGPRITLTNPGGGANAATSLDFNSYPPSTTGTYNPAARIGAADDGNFSDRIVFQSNKPGTPNNALRLNMTILSTGRVGIGTGAPDMLLSVNGNADKVGGGSWATFSDGRLKHLNGSFNSGLSQVLKLHPIRYRYKTDNAIGIQDTEEHIGVVAQEVQRVIPEAVTENNKGYLLVNNDPIIWSMLNAIKEQQALIRKQQTQIRSQQAQILRLASQVSAIQVSSRVSSRASSEVRTVQAQMSLVHQ